MLHAVLLCVLVMVLLLCFSLLLYQGLTGVPTVSSTRAEAADVVALLRSAHIGAHPTIVDLGCGWGALTLALASAFPRATIVGLELSPFPYWVTRLRTLGRPNIRVMRANFYDADLRGADAIVCYLMIKPMPKLAAFLDRVLPDGTPVVALTFWFRGRKVSAAKEGPGLRGSAALYHWPAKQQE
ncbi:trans-aconitate 2-methyltransferase [Beijerinckia sp. L45]|uniref:class I SAM-dependent methyltransferase n=1 Tax=Beijerinckia sp. L45 TaxID=1641855 RepID=UPI00131D9D2E|nr:class I SAM-dependent methyltransferase [Beijerinckia sp. L45]